MKTYAALVLFVGLLSAIISVSLSSFRRDEAPAVRTIEAQYVARVDELAEQAATLLTTVQAIDSTEESVAKARHDFAETRHAFKHIEYLLAYLEEEAIENSLNGGALPRVDPDSDTLKVLAPSGFQAVEEKLYGSDANDEKNAIVALVSELCHTIKEIEMRSAQTKLTDKVVFEAMRLEMVRIMSQGITGFDTPASEKAIVETKAALEGVSNALAAYAKPLYERKPVLANELSTLLKDATAFLATYPDFDSFNRATFVRNFGNPIFGALLDAEQCLNIDIAATPDSHFLAVNAAARNIFDARFLKPEYYTHLDGVKNTTEATELGRALFFDPALSANNRRACASCHNPLQGFTDGKRKSIGYDGLTTVPRNAPTLLNAVFAGRYFDDLRSADMGQQIKAVVESDKEFHSSFAAITQKLERSKPYRQWFKRAFGSDAITEASINKAIIAYEQSLVALSSPFDRYMRGETNNLSPAAVRGFNLFMGKAKCGTCHFAPVFNGLVPPNFHESESEVLGVPLADESENATIDTDLGRFDNRLHKENADHFKHAFKTPTVRNAAITAPYMHNGVFKTLEDVLIFYNRGGGAGIGIDLPNQTLSKGALHLPAPDRDDLEAFIRALTDTARVTTIPTHLPRIDGNKDLKNRAIGGVY